MLKAKKPPPDRAKVRREYLALRPARNPDIEWEEAEGKALLTIPIAKTRMLKIVNIFYPVPEQKKVALDAIGTLVWRHCDGKTSIDKLARELQREYKLGGREAELALQQFLKDLGRRGFIGFATDIKPDKK